VVYNGRSSEVPALDEFPSLDPNTPGEFASEDLGNRYISSVFEPGSTGKLFTHAAAIEEGTVTPETTYEIPYEEWFDGHRIKDSHQQTDQQLTLAGVLRHSSNVGTVKVSETLTPEVRYDYLKAFGLGEKTGVELPGESAGVVHPADQWTGRTRYTIAFGQGYS